MTAAAAKPSSTTPDAVKVKVCTGHSRPICHINYSNIIDGTFWFVTSCHDSKPMLRNGETCDWVGTFEGHRGAVYCSAFNAAATQVVTGSGDYTAVVWDAITGARLHKWEHQQYVKTVDWLDNKIATGNYDGRVRIFDATNYNAEPQVVAVNDKIVKAVYFVEDTNTIVAAAEDQITKWDLRAPSSSSTTSAVTGGSGPLGQPVTKRDLPGLNVLEYTHKYDLVAAHVKSITLFDVKTLLEKKRINTTEDVECASISPDGTHLAIGSKIKAKEYTLEGDGTELENHRGHHGPIFHIRWAPDGNTFATGAEDGMVRVWPSHAVIQKYEG